MTLWNDNWKFWEETDAFSLVWSVPEDARTITLPHDAMLERSPRGDSPNGGDTGFRDGGSYVYVKSFFAPEAWAEKHVLVKFEGIYMNAYVYLNGNLIGKNRYGYTHFCVNLSNDLHYGSENELRVLVKNSGMPNSRWYSGSGIYRDVYLEVTDLMHITPFGLKIATESLEEDYALLSVSAEVEILFPRRREAKLIIRVYAPDGSLSAEADLPLRLAAGAKETITQTVSILQPQVWDENHPNIYSCTATLVSGDITLHEVTEHFGIRTLKLDARKGLRVNGKTVKLRGACIHHDNGLLGAVSLDAAELRRVSILKEAGFNAIRTAHNPPSPALLRACDKLGMYVMDELYDMWSRPKKDNDYSLCLDLLWEKDLTAMVDSAYNHPSVIFYSLGNEIPEVGKEQGAAFGRALARKAKKLDPGRFTMVSINGVFASGDHIGRIMADVLSAAGDTSGNVNNFMAAMDTHMDAIVTHPLVSEQIENAAVGWDLLGYNYMTARYQSDAELYPHRVIVGSETYPPEIPRNWALVKKLPGLIGDFTWTGWDYLGEAGVGVPAYAFGEGGFGAQYPCQLAYCGDMDITGFRRPASYFRQIVFGLRNAPYITVQDPAHYGTPPMKTPWVISDSISSWSFGDFAGKPILVEVYSPGTAVELIQDGKSLGRKPAGEQAGFIALFETTYRPGTLTAIAYEGDTELGRMVLTSAGEAVSLCLEPEATDSDLIYVPIILRDQQGRMVTDQDTELTASVQGGVLLGFGSGDPKPDRGYLGDTAKTFHGRALAILRRTNENMTLTVTASSGLTAGIVI